MTRPGAGVVVFDLDGTLVDSAADLAAAASALVVERGGRALSRDEVVAMVGEGAPVLVRRALTAAGLDPDTPHATARFLELYDARLLDTTALYPGIRAVLDALDPLVALAVLTNKPVAPAERLLEALGVRRYFVEVIGGDGPWPRKPDPAGLLALRGHGAGGPLLARRRLARGRRDRRPRRRRLRAGAVRLRRGPVRRHAAAVCRRRARRSAARHRRGSAPRGPDRLTVSGRPRPRAASRRRARRW